MHALYAYMCMLENEGTDTCCVAMCTGHCLHWRASFVHDCNFGTDRGCTQPPGADDSATIPHVLFALGRTLLPVRNHSGRNAVVSTEVRHQIDCTGNLQARMHAYIHIAVDALMLA